MYRFAHISDIHLASMPRLSLKQWLSKRLLGNLSWHRNRKHHHLEAVTNALRDDLKAQEPDHICVTGDLTNLGTAHEIEYATEWLKSLGLEESISVVPGNHDVYMGESAASMQSAWKPWMGESFPYVHLRGDVAFIGVSTAVATAPFMASGKLGQAQLAELERLLEEHKNAFRVVLIHHPPQAGATSKRKGLSDAKQFRAVLQCAGAELVLHGHTHRTIAVTIPGPTAPIPVLGTGSASYQHHGHYHIIALQPKAGGGHEMQIEHRQFNMNTQRFEAS